MANRAGLITRIVEERDSVAALQDRIARVRERNLALEEQLAGTDSMLASVADDLDRLRVRTGAAAVRGPGVQLVVNEPAEGSERLRKEDLYLLINGLWEAGAEAMSLNGQRLGVLTSINNSNAAINVDSTALRPPYRLQAIGDRGRLAADLLDTSSFMAFASLQERYGFRLDLDSVEQMTLPAARAKRLWHATMTPVDPDGRTDERRTP